LNGIAVLPRFSTKARETVEKNGLLHRCSPESSRRYPLSQYLLSKEGRRRQTLRLLGNQNDYCVTRSTTNKILRLNPATATVIARLGYRREVHGPFVHIPHYHERSVADIKKFAGGGKTAVVSTINGRLERVRSTRSWATRA
jgi:urea transport system substrate-binding protein